MSNVDKSIDKFKSKIEQGSVYDAQQFLKTVYHRLRSRKAYDGSRQLLQLAACIQYKHDEITCGTELATMLIQAYKDDKLLPEQNTIDIERVLSILRALEKAKYSPAEYSSVAKAALKWLNSSSSQPASEAAVQIHASLGKYLFRNKELGKVHVASAHLARGEDMDSLAQVLAEASEELSEDETELLAVHTFLQVLTLPQKPRKTQQLAAELRKHLTSRRLLPTESTATHFMALLQEALDRESLQLVRLLRQEYAFLLSRDPALDKSMTALEGRHFGVRTQGGGLEGLFGGMLGSLFS